jgi:para-aminobenzoate synthetase component 1
MKSLCNEPVQHPVPELLPIPYQADSAGYFHTVAAQLPRPVLLQTDQQDARRGRFDIMSAAPLYWLESRNGCIDWQGSAPDLPPAHSSFAALRQLVSFIESQPADYANCEAQDLPFCGGLIGYCSYDLVRESIDLPVIAEADIAIPDMQFGFYAWCFVQDHHRQRSWLVIHPACTEALRLQLFVLRDHMSANPIVAICALEISSSDIPHGDTQCSDAQCNQDSEHYQQQFFRIQNYIRAGDCYQINYAQRFSLPTKQSAHDVYWRLRHKMPSPFCVLLPVLGTEDHILSFSPERFVQLDSHRNVTTQPIKGTAPRHADAEVDRRISDQLLGDKKNRAENIMIVDLLRNDLGRVCETGSINVEALCELQSFANVHHLVSTIQGRLMAELNAVDLLEACFPGGSITGVPKIRAMQIIEELEPQRRSIYCGNIAYFSAHGHMDSNIAIRTVLLHDNTLYCWGGGGIVADSEVDSEYCESLTKIQTLLDAML